MAFTSTQTQQIMAYLGYSYRLDTNVKSEIETAGQDADLQAASESLLAQMATVDQKLVSATTTAGIESVGGGDTSFFQSGQIRDLRNLGRGLVQKLSIVLAVPKVRDYYGTEGTSNGMPPTFFY